MFVTHNRFIAKRHHSTLLLEFDEDWFVWLPCCESLICIRRSEHRHSLSVIYRSWTQEWGHAFVHDFGSGGVSHGCAKSPCWTASVVEWHIGPKLTNIGSYKYILDIYHPLVQMAYKWLLKQPVIFKRVGYLFKLFSNWRGHFLHQEQLCKRRLVKLLARISLTYGGRQVLLSLIIGQFTIKFGNKTHYLFG